MPQLSIPSVSAPVAVPRPRVLVVSLGGTIAMAASRGGGVAPGLDAAELLAAVPGAAEVAEVETLSLRRVPSNDLGWSDIAALADRIRQARAQGFEGVVVTQGTDTLEETAYLLDLLLEPGAAVVMTGAMRNPTLAGADGPANLLAALRTAVSPDAAGLGVLVVMHDEIHAARWVRKVHAHKAAAFASPLVGPLGWVLEDRARLVLRPMRASPHLPWRGEPPATPLLAIGLGDDARVLAALRRDPPAGLVVAALGAGHVPSALVEGLAELAATRPVVFASRAAAGETARSTYGYPGSEMDLLGRGLIGAGALDAFKARILLALLLADGADLGRIQVVFDAHA